MYIAYLDEAGDDGYPAYSSPLFVLTSVYMHHEVWRGNLDKIGLFRRQLKQDIGLHVSTEMHMRALVLGKKPYHDHRFGRAEKRHIFFAYYGMMSSLDMRAVNVVINKKKIHNKNYRVLDTALTYNAQRIANDMREGGHEHRFMFIADEGRIGSMRRTIRRIQVFNYIPSRYAAGSYRKDLQCLIEDPLPKSSQHSHFIQVADALSFVVSLYARTKICSIPWAKRIRCLEMQDVIQALDVVQPILNLRACPDPYGIVNYPK